MNTTMGKPAGITGTITFDGTVGTKTGVRDAQGRYWVQSVNPHLWLQANIRADQFEPTHVMSEPNTKRGSTHGAGRATLDQRLAARLNVTTSGGLRGQVWTLHPAFQPASGALNAQEREQLRTDTTRGITYVVWSYDTPIAWVTADGAVYHVTQRFSVTTSRHQSITRNAL